MVQEWEYYANGYIIQRTTATDNHVAKIFLGIKHEQKIRIDIVVVVVVLKNSV